MGKGILAGDSPELGFTEGPSEGAMYQVRICSDDQGFFKIVGTVQTVSVGYFNQVIKLLSF